MEQMEPLESYKLYLLDEISQKDIHKVGSKAAVLGELRKAGFAVPKGMVVPTSFFELFMAENNLETEIRSLIQLISETVSLLDIFNLTKQFQQTLKSCEVPKLLRGAIKDHELLKEFPLIAVRSSALKEDGEHHSFAGQYGSYLNLTRQELLPAIRACWVSQFSFSSMVYQKQNGMLSMRNDMGVILQKQINSDVSGVIFTAHPLTHDNNIIVVEMINGLGEELVSGKKEPVHLELKRGGEIPVDQSMIQRRLLKQLMQLSIDIENLFNQPVDIEWAILNDKVYVLQARPITSVPPDK
jgi:phosphoenolpyruvate synthase/pyruvate phosphate dikinase